jgi:hypothetical protein
MRRAILVLAAALALTAAARGDDGPRVVARDAEGAVVAEVALPADGRFALAYRHSVYEAPAEERFRARGDGFALESVASPNRRVLEYYELEGRIARDVLVPARPARFTTLALAATERGRRTLVVGGERFPLYGHGVHLTIGVER